MANRGRNLKQRVEDVTRKEARQAHQRPVGGKLRVLVVDDHTIVRQTMAARLAAEPDIEVVDQAAATGEMALTLTRRVHPDVVIMDVNMPGIGGVEATRLIKQELPGVTVIAVSMHTEPQTVEAMRNVGADEFLSKEASVADLLKALRRYRNGLNAA